MHLYDHLNDKWIRQASKPQPYIQVRTTLCPEDYSALGFRINTSGISTYMPTMADTGWQGCLAGIKAIHKLNYVNGTSSQYP